jgi:hypothetical protein
MRMTGVAAIVGGQWRAATSVCDAAWADGLAVWLLEAGALERAADRFAPVDVVGPSEAADPRVVEAWRSCSGARRAWRSARGPRSSLVSAVLAGLRALG